MTLRVFLIAVALSAHAVTGYASDTDAELRRLNNLNVPENFQPQENDPALVNAFQHYQFDCRSESGFNPKESKTAQERFDAFVTYFNRHRTPTDEQAKKRLDLLTAATKSGSWKAKYVDMIWEIREVRGGPRAQALAKELTGLAEEGIPIAIYQYVERMGGFYDQPDERNRMLKAAIDRGSPQAMALVGGSIASRSVVLRELGKKLLACAIKQGEPQAYESLGKIAWHEGRWVDAYRLWEQGANKGCEDCIGRMEQFSTLRADFHIDDGVHGSNSTLKALRGYYADQRLYQITNMHTLLTPASRELQFHVTDEQLVSLVKKESAARAIFPRKN